MSYITDKLIEAGYTNKELEDPRLKSVVTIAFQQQDVRKLRVCSRMLATVAYSSMFAHATEEAKITCEMLYAICLAEAEWIESH